MARLFPLTFRMAILAVLAVIGLQAMPERPLPVTPYDGSAFSADTAQVTLSPRAGVGSELRALPAPTPPVEPVSGVLKRLAPSIVTARPLDHFYRATAPPPPSRIALGDPSRRGPPLPS